jgi:hypothetical protein
MTITAFFIVSIAYFFALNVVLSAKGHQHQGFFNRFLATL